MKQKTLNITPVAKPRMTRSDRWKQRPVVLAYRSYGDALRLMLPGYSLPAAVRLTFTVPMPKSWSEKKRAQMRGKPHQQRPDVDNFTKAVLDHLAEDDSYVWRTDAIKLWGDKGSVVLEDLT